MSTTFQTGLVTNWMAITTRVGLVVRFSGQHVSKSSSCSRSLVHPSISSKIPTNKIGSNLCFQFIVVCVCVFPMCVLYVCGKLILIKMLFPTTTLGFY